MTQIAKIKAHAGPIEIVVSYSPFATSSGQKGYLVDVFASGERRMRQVFATLGGSQKARARTHAIHYAYKMQRRLGKDVPVIIKSDDSERPVEKYL